MAVDKKADRPVGPDRPDKRKILRQLADRFAQAMCAELLSHRKHLDALSPTRGARTPTPEELTIVRATKQGWLAKSRERIMLLNQMEDLLGIVHRPGKSAREALDDIPDDPT